MACLTSIFKMLTLLLFICKINMNIIGTGQEIQIGETDTVFSLYYM